MRITGLDVCIVRAPDTGRPQWGSHFVVPRANEILVRLDTDEGIEGIGIATSYTPIDSAIHAFRSGFADLIIGADPLAPERLYQTLFALTWPRRAHERGWPREALVRISAAVDIAVWDIVGKVAGLPVYRLFGGYRSEVPCYVTCAYYRDGKDLAELRDEMEMLKAQGHTGFKAKAGGVGLAEDIERLAVVREVIGDDKDLMVDVNWGWDLATVIEGARLLEPLRPRWLEEPVRWADDRRELRLLGRQTRIPLSAGESELTGYGCRALLEEEAIQILQFDCTMMGGFTEGRKLAALCELNHVQGSGGSPPRLLHRRRQPRRLHRRVLHRSGTGPAAGRAGRGPAADRQRMADREGSSGIGADPVETRAREIRRANPVNWSAGRT